MERLTWIAGTVLFLHLIVGILHGLPHFVVPVNLEIWQWGFILLIINLGPLAGFLLIWTENPNLGSGVFAVSMAYAFIFGIYHHFLVHNPDNVSEVHGFWHLPFLLTATFVTLTDLAGVVTGVWGLKLSDTD